MKIIEFKAENIKNLKAVEITPTGNTVMLTGKNGAGKSAVLMAILMALTGKKIDEPIRRGEERAEVSIDLGKYVVKKIWTAKGDRLEVKSKDGAVYPSPQSLLNDIIGSISFDPLEFMEMKEGQQRDLILDMAGVSLDKFKAKRQEVFNERTATNREAKKLEGALTTIERPPEGATGEVIKTSDIIENIESLSDKRDLHMRASARRREREARELEIRRVIDLYHNELNELEAEGKLPMPERIEDEQIHEEKQKLAQAEENNKTAYEVKKYRETEAELEDSRIESDDLTIMLNDIDREKDKKIKSTQFPIDGLSVTDDAVIYKNIPIGQLSTGEQIKVSTAIAMAMNPGLKVIFVKEGSLLDADGLKEMIGLIKDDYQIWIEKVADTGEVGIFIEDGEITAVNGETL